MNLDVVREKIQKLQGKEVQLRISGSRSHVEVLRGEIDTLYPNVFTVRTLTRNRSFSYSDVAIGDVEIYLV